MLRWNKGAGGPVAHLTTGNLGDAGCLATVGVAKVLCGGRTAIHAVILRHNFNRWRLAADVQTTLIIVL